MRLATIIAAAGLAFSAAPAAAHERTLTLRIPAHGEVAWHSKWTVRGDVVLDRVSVNRRRLLLSDLIATLYGQRTVVTFSAIDGRRFSLRAASVRPRAATLRVRYHVER